MLTPGRWARTMAATSLPDPYLRPVEGDVYGQEYWDSNAGIDIIRQVVAGHFYPPVYLLFGLRMPTASEGPCRTP